MAMFYFSFIFRESAALFFDVKSPEITLKQFVSGFYLFLFHMCEPLKRQRSLVWSNRLSFCRQGIRFAEQQEAHEWFPIRPPLTRTSYLLPFLRYLI